MANITWAASTTSTTPPQALSDALALSGTSNFSAQVVVVNTGMIDFFVGVYGSTDGGVTYNLIGSEQHALGGTTLNFGPITTGSYDHAKIHNRIGPGGYTNGFFHNSTWTTTLAAFPAELLGGAPWWVESPGSNLGKAAETLGGSPWWTESSSSAVGKQAGLVKFSTGSAVQITISPGLNQPQEGS